MPLKIFTIAAYLVLAFWLFGLGYMLAHVHDPEASAVGGRWIVEMATISFFGVAILEAVKRRRIE